VGDHGEGQVKEGIKGDSVKGVRWHYKTQGKFRMKSVTKGKNGGGAQT